MDVGNCPQLIMQRANVVAVVVGRLRYVSHILEERQVRSKRGDLCKSADSCGYGWTQCAVLGYGRWLESHTPRSNTNAIAAAALE